MMNRRKFLQQAAQLTGGLGLAGLAGPKLFDAHANASQPSVAASPLFKISLAEWSLHKTIFAGKLDNLDFAKTAKQDYGIEAIEFVNRFFKDNASNMDYLRELKKRAKGEGVRMLLIMCDGEGRLGDPEAAKRAQAVENHYKWADAAKFLGCHSIRVNAASEGSFEEQQKLAADGLARLTAYGAKLNLNVIVENHGGLSSHGAWLAGVMKMVNHSRCGTLPDFGNFCLKYADKGCAEEYDRYQGVQELMPFAKAVSAKSNDFAPNGDEAQKDYRRLLKLVMAAGYHGYVGIEYEGNVLSESDGIRATKKLLEKVRDELAQG